MNQYRLCYYSHKCIVYSSICSYCTFYGFDKCITSCIHNCNFIQSSFATLRMLSAPPSHPSSTPPEPLDITDLFIVSTVWPFTECHIAGITVYGIFRLASWQYALKIHSCISCLDCLFVFVTSTICLYLNIKYTFILSQ